MYMYSWVRHKSTRQKCELHNWVRQQVFAAQPGALTTGCGTSLRGKNVSCTTGCANRWLRHNRVRLTTCALTTGCAYNRVRIQLGALTTRWAYNWVRFNWVPPQVGATTSGCDRKWVWVTIGCDHKWVRPQVGATTSGCGLQLAATTSGCGFTIGYDHKWVRLQPWSRLQLGAGCNSVRLFKHFTPLIKKL
jgi:hypothetical protein